MKRDTVALREMAYIALHLVETASNDFLLTLVKPSLLNSNFCFFQWVKLLSTHLARRLHGKDLTQASGKSGG